MSGFPHAWFKLISFFFSSKLTILSCLFVCLVIFYVFMFKTILKYYSIVTLEIRIFPFPVVFCCSLWRSAVAFLFSDFSELSLQRLHSSSCVLTEIGFVISAKSPDRFP